MEICLERTRHQLSRQPWPASALCTSGPLADPREYAGVAFAVDPVSGRNDHAVVAAVAGLGTVLVDGAADATSWRVDLSGTIIDTQPAEQRCKDTWGADGIARHELEYPAPVCSDAKLIAAVAELARRCSDRKGAPQDIEWAWDGDNCGYCSRGPSPPMASILIHRRAPPSGTPRILQKVMAAPLLH